MPKEKTEPKEGGATGKRSYEALVILGVVDDSGSLLPGWDYPYSRAEERAVAMLKKRGYGRIGVFREPDEPRLRRLLAARDLKAVVFIGHGELHSSHYSFRLNGKQNISSGDFRHWALEDVVTPRLLSKKTKQRMTDDPSIAQTLEQASSYNLDLAVFHSCNSLRDPGLRAALGGEFHGNPWPSFINLPPLASRHHQPLPVDPEAFSENPLDALQAALLRALQKLGPPEEVDTGPAGGTVDLSKDPAALRASLHRSALHDALARLLEAKQHGGGALTLALAALRNRFSIDFRRPPEGYGPPPPADDPFELLDTDRRRHRQAVLDCGMPTKSSDGTAGCRRPVCGGGPCWQHDDGFELPEEIEDAAQ